MERNSDLIVLSSYAPPLRQCQSGRNAVGFNLIGYDAMTSCESPATTRRRSLQVSGNCRAGKSSLTSGSQRFFYSVTQDAAKGVAYLKLVNANSTPQTVKIGLSGAAKIGGTGTLVTLSGLNPAETNTISVPTRVVPVKTELKGAGSSFSHTVPPFAIQVLQISTK